MMAAKKLREERGAVTVVIAAALAALLLSVAVVADLGLLYQERRQLQTSTDAAALAAAMDIAEGRGSAVATARAIEYVSTNANIPPSQINVEFPAADRVRVVAKTERSIPFSGLIGRETAQVAAGSTAALGAARGVANLVPFVVPLQRVRDFTGEANAGTFELGEDRPLDPFSKLQTVSGDTITYTITYNNTGDKAESISVRDPIPGGAVYINGSATAGGVYNSSTKEIAWSFSGIAPGDYREMRFSVKVTAGPVKTITNTAFLTNDGKTTSAATDGGGGQRGYFWLVDFDGGSKGVPQYDAWIRYGYPGYVYPGDIQSGPGVKASLKDAMTWRMGFNPKVIIPVYSFTQRSGSKGTYHVVGFAEFVITGFDFSGMPKTISGYFTNGTVAKGVPGPMPAGYFGIDAIWLVS
ncbi:MAG: DUF11 domain-containing protein [Actinobacteria bacterium]|nr:DUF11 domain-containing protein [Actinomycetota bacterium]